MDSANQGQSVRPSVEKLPKSCKKVIDENCKGCEENPIDFPCSIHDCKMIEKMRERLDALEKTESIRRDRFVEMTNQLNPMEYLIKEINEKVAALEANKVNREVFELDIGGLGNEVKKLEEWKQKWETPETDHLEPKGINFILEAHLKRITELERQSTELKKETMYNEKESLKDYIWNRLNHVKSSA